MLAVCLHANLWPRLQPQWLDEFAAKDIEPLCIQLIQNLLEIVNIPWLWKSQSGQRFPENPLRQRGLQGNIRAGGIRGKGIDIRITVLEKMKKRCGHRCLPGSMKGTLSAPEKEEAAFAHFGHYARQLCWVCGCY